MRRASPIGLPAFTILVLACAAATIDVCRERACAQQPQMTGEPPKVRVMRLPEGGIQPAAAVGDDGTIHLVYLHGADARAGNLLYIRSTDGGVTFSRPLRVNTVENSALAIGSVRGSQIAIGRDGRVHVLWNASGVVRMNDPHKSSPLLHARMTDDGTAFEPERNVITSRFGLDGGGAIAADRNGRVYAIWHAPEGEEEGEAHRRLWLAISTDGGVTFAPEKAIDAQGLGCCACCGVAAYCSSRGDLYVLYRCAKDIVHRDMHLLVSNDGGATFTRREVDQWEAGQCVMSTASFADAGSAGLKADEPKPVWAAWETRGRVRLARLPTSDGSNAGEVHLITPADQGDNAKHPALASNSRGQVLLAWTAETAWNKGGSVAWQVFDDQGRAIEGSAGTAPDLPVWGMVAVAATNDGGFLLAY